MSTNPKFRLILEAYMPLKRAGKRLVRQYTRQQCLSVQRPVCIMKRCNTFLLRKFNDEYT
jgi:hypothetical protein